MKFLCPSCKAKYQIADEKVIGRSVKMKCRQCGHVIEIQESVVGATAGVSQPPIALASLTPPPATTSHASEDMADRPSTNAGVGLAAKAPNKPVRPGGTASADRRPSGIGSPGINRNLKPPGTAAGGTDSPPRVAGLPARSVPVAGSSALPPRAQPPRATSSGPASERPAPRPTFARTPAASSPAPPAARAPLRNVGIGKSTPSPAEARVSPIGLSARAGSELTPAPVAVGIAQPVQMAALSPRRTGEALAEAFTTAVAVAAPVTSDQFVGDEWYVGINDSPIGPIPLSELRARAAQGQVTVDSLVWRDGFEDWKPVRSFPELLAVVEEAISSLQASRGPIAPAFAPIDYGPAIALPPPAQERQPIALAPAAEVGVKPAQESASLFVPIASPSITPEELAAFTGRGRRSPKGAWIAVAGALSLGLAIGFVFFRQAPATPEIKYVEVARSGAVDPVAAPSAPIVTHDTPAVASAEETRTNNIRRVASGDSKTSAETSGTPNPSTGLKGLSGLRALGPQSGPAETSGNSGASAGQALDSATLQKTVSKYTASVKRSCWQPALDSRAPDAPTGARVAVKIDIAPGGNVSGVSSSGDPRGYRGLATCIESRVRNWSFPPSSGATTVNVPFVFAAQ